MGERSLSIDSCIFSSNNEQFSYIRWLEEFMFVDVDAVWPLCFFWLQYVYNFETRLTWDEICDTWLRFSRLPSIDSFPDL